jgi:DeoR/GlpR family transcriptional regulator of sugar metabolism
VGGGGIYLKRAMIKAASPTYLLAGSTKVGRTSFPRSGRSN